MESGCSIPPDAGPSAIMPRWAKLIGEYEALRDALREHTRLPHWPGVAPYIAMLKTEASLAQRALDSGEAFAVAQALTNIAARETMWRLIKTSPGGLIALERKFPRSTGGKTASKAKTVVNKAAVEISATSQRKGRQYRHWGSVGGMNANGSRAEGVFVNAVVGDGFEWLRVLTLTTAQLLVSMAENGWDWGEDDEEDEEEDGDDDDNPALTKLEAIADIPLVETILDLVDVARENRSRGAYAHICVVLTRVDDDDPSTKGAGEVARFLRVLRDGLAALASTLDCDIDGHRLEVTVHTARSPRAMAQSPATDLPTALARMMPDVADQLTPTINVDTSILIALASDISHQPVTVCSWFPTQRVDEIAHEEKQPGQLLKSLCEAMRGRRLVCTREAADAFRTMIRDMGQDSEQKRAALLVEGVGAGEGAGAETDMSRDERLQQYRLLSQHGACVPDDLMLPIAVVDEAWDMQQIKKVAASGTSQMPAVAARVAHDMHASVPTLSVFFYGWASGHTTITTNSTARNKIIRLLETHRTTSRQVVPHVRLCRPVRSLNGTNPRGSDDGGVLRGC